MKALLFKKNGNLKEIPINQIDTITGDSDGLCIHLTNGQGEIFYRFLTFEPDNSQVKSIIETIVEGEKENGKLQEINKKRALAFLEENTKYRYIKSKGLDPDKEYYIDPKVAREAIEIALGERMKGE